MLPAGPMGPAGARSGGVPESPAGDVRFDGMERPPLDPARLLAQWMEWENGEVSPGRAMANLKTGGLREVLEKMAAEATKGEPAEH